MKECDFCGCFDKVKCCEKCNKKMCKNCEIDADFLEMICEKCPIKKQHCDSCVNELHITILDYCEMCSNLICNSCSRPCIFCDSIGCIRCITDITSSDITPYLEILNDCNNCGFYTCIDCFNKYSIYVCVVCNKFSCPKCYPLNKNRVCLACKDYNNLNNLYNNNQLENIDKFVFHNKWLIRGYKGLIFNSLYNHMFNIINNQKEHIQSLELAIEYMPGGPKYLEAKEDFESRQN